MSHWKPDIFSYLNYRGYLGDYYTAAKANQPHFSYRYFSRRAGFSSSNFLKLVIDGKRNLSHASVDKIAEAIGLSAEEHRFLAHLVSFGQADTDDERAQHLEVLTATRRFWDAKPLDGMVFEYLSSWCNVAIRELAARADFEATPEWIAAQLQPPITTAQAASSLALLLNLGLLVREESGRISRGETTLDAGHEVTALGVRQFHRQMLERARDAMDVVKAKKRDVSGMTVCVRADQIDEVKRRVREFRESLMSFCDDQDDPDVVYQINIQVFPLSTQRGDE